MHLDLTIIFLDGPDPFANNFNAFDNPWPNSIYAFPHIKLVSKFIARFLQLNIEFGLLVCLFWPSQPYFPLLTSFFDEPFLIPVQMVEDASTLPKNISAFLVCSITSRPAKCNDFQRKEHAYCKVSNLQHYVPTSEHGKHLQIGVINKRSITALCL